MFVQSCGFQGVFSFTDLHKPGCADEALERPKSIQALVRRLWFVLNRGIVCNEYINILYLKR